MVPSDRAPGKSWSPGPASDSGAAEVPAGRPIRVGYERCSTARQELASQLAALREAGCTRVFSAEVQLELLSGPLTGIYDPNGMGAMLFAVLAVAAQLDRESWTGSSLASGPGEARISQV